MSTLGSTPSILLGYRLNNYLKFHLDYRLNDYPKRLP